MAATVASTDSARFALPATTTTDPDESCAATSPSASAFSTTRRCVPGSYRSDFQAYRVRPVSIGENSRIREPRFSAA